MRLNGEDRDLLIQKRVRLVQSGCFKDNINLLDEKDINGLDDIISFDYMGSAEFEWGSLPRSLRRMTLNKDFYKVFTFNQYKDKNGYSLKVYAPKLYLKNVQNIIDRLVVNGEGLQEDCTLHKYIADSLKCKSNFWWDIENDFFIFFENTDKIIQAMEALKKRKFGYENNTAKSALSNIYLKLIKKPNFSCIMDCKTFIKDYHYSENDKIHFIEFSENIILENILMEAMIIAKVDKGTVVFNINDNLFNITEETILDDIIVEKSIKLKDTSKHSIKIKELINLYNEEFLKKEKQKQLVNVLKLVYEKKSQE